VANKEQVEILNKGVRAWNEWRIEAKLSDDHPLVELAGANLSGIDLSSVDIFTT